MILMNTLKYYMKYICILTGVIVGIHVLPGTAMAVETNKEKVVFGIVPQQSASRLAEVWVPFLDYLSRRSGVQVVFATAKDIPTFEACLVSGAYDVAYMNPYHYTVFHETPGYTAFARQKKKRLRGLVVARKDSGVEELRDLRGQAVAFPSPAAFGASVVPRAEMRAAGIAIRPLYVKSHDSVYRAVAAGLMTAGGGVLRTFGNIDPEIRNQLKIIYKTKAYTPHAFAAHPNMSGSTVTAISDAMVAAEQRAPALLEPLGMKGFQASEDKDWNDIRALRLSRSQTEISAAEGIQCLSG